MQKTGGIISKCMTHAFNTRINRSVNRFRHLLCSLFRDKRDSAGAIFALTLYTFERSSKRINLTYACSIQYIINNPDASVGAQCSTFRTVCSIRWLQSALIPFVTTQSVRQNYTSVYSFDCKLWLCHNIAAVRNHRRPWRLRNGGY